MCLLLIYNSAIQVSKGGDEVLSGQTTDRILLLLLVLCITKDEDEVAALTRLQGYFHIV